MPRQTSVRQTRWILSCLARQAMRQRDSDAAGDAVLTRMQRVMPCECGLAHLALLHFLCTRRWLPSLVMAAFPRAPTQMAAFPRAPTQMAA